MLKARKYQWGGLTSPAYSLTYNQGTDLYDQLKQGSFNNIGGLFSNNILQNPNLDLFGQSLKYNMNTKTTLDNIKKISSNDSVIGNSNYKPSSNTLNTIGNISQGISSILSQKQQSQTTQGLNQAYDTVSNSVNAIPGIGPAISAGMKFGGALSDGLTALGVGTSQLTLQDKILDSKWFKWNVGLVNALGAEKGLEMKKDSKLFSQMGGGYSGTEAFIDKTAEGNGTYGLTSRKQLNKHNQDAAKGTLQQTQIGAIRDENEIAQAGANNPLLPLGIQMSMNGSYSYNTRKGKSGFKIDRDFAKKVVKLSKGKKEDKIPGFKNGGTVNVIPDGALHKNKHHLENVDEKFEDVTTKGIPVITESAGGDITQHAEVEREEIIFNLDVTKQLEKLMEDGSDEAAIEAGKLLVREILENTVDNTGLLNKIK